MKILALLQTELQNEYQITKEFIAKFPNDNATFKPHEKSMDITTLANHIVEIFAWPAIIFSSDKMDFAAGDYKPTSFATADELVNKLDEDYKQGNLALENASDDDLSQRWQVTAGETIFADFSKYEAVRHALNQITHHRAQLGVYYRLLNIALPSSYGPSADTEDFK